MKAAVDCHMVGSPTAGDAGNGRYAAALVGALAATAGPGDEVLALTTSPGAMSALAPDTRGLRVPSGNVERLAHSAERALQHADADAAVFTYISPLRSRARIGLAIHDPTFLTNPEWLSRRARWVLRPLTPQAVDRAFVVLALSQTAKTDICATLGLEDDRVAVVSPTANAAFRPTPGAAERVAARHGIRDYVLAVGDLGPRKNLPALAEAVTRLGRPGLELALVGRPARGADDVLGAAGVQWLGPVRDEELADLYCAAAVVAHPSLYEGFGLTVLEAMACGSPVVVSDRGALPEIVGRAGIVVRPTPDALADGIRAALEPLTAGRLRSAGPDRAAAFTVSGMGEAAWAALGRSEVP